MRVLVTGGTGYLGRAILRALAARGHEPVAFARQASRAGLDVATIDGDIRDRTAVVGALRGCDAVCHTAALVSIWRPDPREFDDVNVGGLEHVISGAREAGVGRIVYTSSFLAEPPAGKSEPIRGNDYQRTKAAALIHARRARDTGAPLVILKPGVLYGPGVRTEGNLIGRLLADQHAGRLPGIVGADRIWSFAWVDDVAASHAVALEQAPVGAEFALGGENAPQMRAFEIARAHGLRSLPRRLPVWAVRAAGWLDEGRARWTGRPPTVTRDTVAVLREDWPLDSEPAQAALGHQVRALDDGIARVMAEVAFGPSAATLGPSSP